MDARIKDFYRYTIDGGYVEMWRRSVRQYYGLDQDGGYARSSAVTFGGEQGELVLLDVNHYSSLINEAHTLVTGSRPAYKAISGAESHSAYEETLLAQQVIDYDMHHKRLENALKLADLTAFIWGEGHVLQIWDRWGGKPYAASMDGQIITEGDIYTIPLRPIDVVRDVYEVHYGDSRPDWLITRRRMNRWKLLKRFGSDPDIERAIRNAVPIDEEAADQMLWAMTGLEHSRDVIYGWELWYPPNELLPQGKAALMVGNKIIDAQEFEDDMPVHTHVTGISNDRCFGFSPMWHLLAPQAALDAAESTAQTNHDLAGSVNWWTDDESGIDVDDLGGGAKQVYSSRRPELVETPNVIDQSIKLAQHRQKTLETLSGINSVQRGDPDSQLKSGAALALVQSMAVQHHSNPHASYAELNERVMSGRLSLYRKYATTERLMKIAGDATATVKRWRGPDLGEATQVVVELANPMMQTSQGRKALADEYADRQWIMSPEQHAEVMRTGRTEPLFRRDRNELRLIGAQNERIRESAQRVTIEQLLGMVEQAQPLPPPPMAPQLDPMTGQPMPPPPPPEPVPAYQVYSQAGLIPKAVVGHRHSLHIRETLAEAASPEAFENEAYAELLLSFVQWHADLYEQLVQTRPWLLEAIGEPIYESALQMMQAQAGPPPGAGMPPEAMPAEEAMAPPPQAQVPALEANPQVDPASLPSMPTNPLTGDPAMAGQEPPAPVMTPGG